MVLAELKLHNVYALDLRMAAGHQTNVLNGGELIDADVPALRASINSRTELLEVGHIVSDTASGNLSFDFKLKGKTHTVETHDKRAEGLLYPILFPYGEDGWDRKDKGGTEYMQYMLNRLMMPEQDPWTEYIAHLEDGTPYTAYKNRWSMMNKDNTMLLSFNRFDYFARLSQYYMVEGVSRAIDYRLNWMKTHAETIYGLPQSAITDSNEERLIRIQEGIARKAAAAAAATGRSSSASAANPNLGHASGGPRPQTPAGASSTSPTSDIPHALNHSHSNRGQDPQRVSFCNSNPSYLAESFSGGPRHRKALATNALTLVSELGDGIGFLTLTCNQHWPEIQSQMRPGDTAFDRSLIVCQVFKQRLSMLLNNLR